MKKRFISLLMSIVLLLTMLPTVVFAADAVSISTNKNEVSAGETFTVTLNIPAVEDRAYSAAFRIGFNSDVFEVTSFTPPTISGGSLTAFSTDAEANAAGEVSCSYEGSAQENTIDLTQGAAMSVTFNVKANANIGEYEFTVDSSKNFAKNVASDGYTESDLISVASGLKTTVNVTNASGGSPSDDYTVSLTNASSDLVAVGGTVNLNLNVNKAFNSAKIVLDYDTDYLTFNENGGSVAGGQTMGDGDQAVSITNDAENGTITIIDYGTAFTSGTAYTLSFTAKAATTETEVSFTSAGLSTAAQANDSNLIDATTKTPVYVPIGYTVTVNDVDAGTVAVNGSYTLDLSSEYNSNYTYTVNNNVGTLTDKGNGVWEITNIDDNLTLTWNKTAIEYDVTWHDSENLVADTEKVNKATCEEDIVFNMPANVPKDGTKDGTNYVATVVRTNADNTTTTITPAISTVDNKQVVKISKEEITGNIAITVKSQTVPADQVTLTIKDSSEVKYNGEYVTTVTVAKNSTVELTLVKETGYDYTVTVGGQTVSVGTEGTFSVSVENTDVEVVVTKTLATSGVQADLYLALDADATQGNDLYLVYIETAEITDKTYQYNGQNFFYSTKTDAIGYNAYCLLVEAVSADAAIAAVKAENALSLVGTTATKIVYTGDVNMTGKVDINDAQLVWNMYNVSSNIISFSTDAKTMEKYLRADVNGNRVLNVAEDAVAVVSKAS